MDNDVQDYLFDLQGYLVLKNAISAADLREMNQWIDDHASYVQEPWSTDGDAKKRGRWIGHIETHTYNEENGVNFQSIIEGGPVFEKLIDHPAWIDLVKKYIHSSVNGLSIHENFLNVRGPGGYLHIHCGGHVPLSYLTFRQNNTGEWMVGQINVLMALNDIGEGDGPPVLIPGSHK
ncbi:MAG: phytanoyl-CoA dioxygenase family protein, partial [Gemmatimonadota bacterium]|nr:phytanoyl-CoA dioxygenase family protein [Gemmatimonadota bacterium]